MVVIHVKGESEEQQFLYECPSTSFIDKISDAIIEISNLQSQIQTLSLSLRRRVLTDAFKESCPDGALALDRALSEAEAYVSKHQVIYKRILSPRILRDHVQTIEKEVQVADLKGLLDPDMPQLFSDYERHVETQLWWAGKELMRGKKLSEYIGGNEKTKIIIRMKSACSCPQNHSQSDPTTAEATITSSSGEKRVDLPFLHKLPAAQPHALWKIKRHHSTCQDIMFGISVW